MKRRMEIKQGSLSFDVKNSIATLLGFRKILYRAGQYTSQQIIIINNIIVPCNVISGVKDIVMIQTYNKLLILLNHQVTG